MEADLKISNQWSDLSRMLKLSSGDQNKIKTARNENDIQWKMTYNY